MHFSLNQIYGANLNDREAVEEYIFSGLHIIYLQHQYFRGLFMETRQNVENKLRKLGANGCLRGYQYAIDAICLLVEDEQYLHKIGAVYQKVAKRNGIPAARVERSIRVLIDYVFNKGNHDLLCTYAGWPLSKQPTNKAFLEMLSYAVAHDNA